MPAIAITGATGKVGREAVRALEDDRLELFTHHATEEIDSEVLDVSDRTAI
jgi:L-arabinose 1-dehydrogenase [NAD(P)+]